MDWKKWTNNDYKTVHEDKSTLKQAALLSLASFHVLRLKRCFEYESILQQVAGVLPWWHHKKEEIFYEFINQAQHGSYTLSKGDRVFRLEIHYIVLQRCIFARNGAYHHYWLESLFLCLHTQLYLSEFHQGKALLSSQFLRLSFD